MKYSREKRLYEKGYSLSQVGDIVGVSVMTVRKRLLNIGVKMRSRGAMLGSTRNTRAEQLAEEMKSLYLEGKSVREIADLFNLSKSCVGVRLREQGVESRWGTLGSELELYNEGLSIYKIASIVGLSPCGVWKRLKTQDVVMRRGTKGNRWSISKRGRYYTGSDGYVYDRTVKKPGRGKTERLHRVVMEQCLNRKLRRGEVVHHKDSNHSNNSLSNLEVLTSSEHSRRHHLGIKNPAKGDSMRGKKHKPESIQKMSKARKRYWELKRKKI